MLFISSSQKKDMIWVILNESKSQKKKKEKKILDTIKKDIYINITNTLIKFQSFYNNR